MMWDRRGRFPHRTRGRRATGRCLQGALSSFLARWGNRTRSTTTCSAPGSPSHSLSAYGITSIATHPTAGKVSNADGFTQRTALGDESHGVWEWTSYGTAKPDIKGSTYLWVSTSGQHKLGGFLNLRMKDGRIHGFSLPTLSSPAAPKGMSTAWPVDGALGKAHGETWFAWDTPTPVGSTASNVALIGDGGRHLYGTTYIQDAHKKWSYTWQAQLIKGAPLE